MKFRRQIIRPASLTTRLALWFALAAILTFTGVGTYLYHSLAARLEQRDDQELLGKIGLLRHIAQEAGSIAAIRADPHGFIDAVSGHDKMSVTLRSKDATLILHDQEQQGEFPTLPATPLASMPQRSAIVQINDSAGQPARAVAAEARIKASGELLDITVARMTSDRMEILDNYRHEVWLAAGCGTLLAALLGFFLVRTACSRCARSRRCRTRSPPIVSTPASMSALHRKSCRKWCRPSTPCWTACMTASCG